MPPLVSVVIPTYNSAPSICQAIDTALAQTFGDVEIIVVDDGSTDGTAQVVAAYEARIRYVYQVNQGIGAARNTGIRLARGIYVAFLDSDDLWLPEKLARQMPVFDIDPEVGLVCAQAWSVDARGCRLPDPPLSQEFGPTDLTLERLVLANPCITSTVVARKHCLEELGGFDQVITYGEDWDLWLRTATRYHLVMVPEPLASIRQHAGATHWPAQRYPPAETLVGYMRIMDKVFASWPAVPPAGLRDRARASRYVGIALDEFAIGHTQAAQDHLEVAAALHEKQGGFLANLAKPLTNYALAFPDPALGLAAHDGPDYARIVLDNLPTGFSNCRAFRRQIMAEVHIGLAFKMHRRGDSNAVRRHVLEGVRRDPAWMHNPGVASIFLQSIVGPARMRSLRRLGHALLPGRQPSARGPISGG